MTGTGGSIPRFPAHPQPKLLVGMLAVLLYRNRLCIDAFRDA